MRKSRIQGFTLIEIMIVLVIVAVMSGVIVLNVNAPSYSRFMSETLKISSLLEIIADESVYTNSVIVCDVARDGFACQSYKNGDWQEVNLKNLVAWGWPENLEIKQTYANGVPLKENEKIRFYPTGDLAPMSFEITDGVHNAWIDGDMSGTFVVNN